MKDHLNLRQTHHYCGRNCCLRGHLEHHYMCFLCVVFLHAHGSHRSTSQSSGATTLYFERVSLWIQNSPVSLVWQTSKPQVPARILLSDAGITNTCHHVYPAFSRLCGSRSTPYVCPESSLLAEPSFQSQQTLSRCDCSQLGRRYCNSWLCIETQWAAEACFQSLVFFWDTGNATK